MPTAERRRPPESNGAFDFQPPRKPKLSEWNGSEPKRSEGLDEWLPPGFASHVSTQSPDRPTVPAVVPRRSDSELRRAEERASAAEQRAERAERELTASRERIATLKRAAAHAAAAQHPDPAPPSAPNGELNLNQAGFEALRAAGLSVSQAARLIGQRDQVGGFTSLDDVDGIRGLPREIKRTLKDVGTV